MNGNDFIVKVRVQQHQLDDIGITQVLNEDWIKVPSIEYLALWLSYLNDRHHFLTYVAINDRVQRAINSYLAGCNDIRLAIRERHFPMSLITTSVHGEDRRITMCDKEYRYVKGKGYVLKGDIEERYAQMDIPPNENDARNAIVEWLEEGHSTSEATMIVDNAAWVAYSQETGYWVIQYRNGVQEVLEIVWDNEPDIGDRRYRVIHQVMYDHNAPYDCLQYEDELPRAVLIQPNLDDEDDDEGYDEWLYDTLHYYDDEEE